MTMRVVDLIRKKREGLEHTREEIFQLVDACVSGEAADYQMSAWMMAVYFRGLSESETAALTDAMVRSGEVLNLDGVRGIKVDKHSTGGVGDKTSLILAPIVAACGLTVPMISGRGLGHTGGTLDKLESIPGFRVALTGKEIVKILKRCGAVIAGQTESLVPADRKMYALRDVTATIESAPLICGSIMSKKLAEGIDALVLDVKTGSGAFMQRAEDAEKLARIMVQTGKRMGNRVVALITDMDQPLGRMVGNSLEVRECIEIMKGERHSLSEDLIELSLELSAWMLFLGRRAKNLKSAKVLAREVLASGKALEVFRRMCAEQGAAASFVKEFRGIPIAKHTREFRARESGFLTRVQCDAVGKACLALGGGRSKAGDPIDHSVGLEIHCKLGGVIKKGDVMVTIHCNDSRKLEQALEVLSSAFVFGPSAPTRQVLVKKVIQSSP
jgi:pyrimidine-nucleoside phosphorylase